MSDIVKLTPAPTAAKTAVLATSAVGILNAILKKVPPMVPTKVGLLAVSYTHLNYKLIFLIKKGCLFQMCF